MRYWQIKRPAQKPFAAHNIHTGGRAIQQQSCGTYHSGLPPTTVIGGTSCVTTLFAPTIEPYPMVTPGKIVELMPIHTLSSMTMGRPYVALRLSGSGSWLMVIRCKGQKPKQQRYTPFTMQKYVCTKTRDTVGMPFPVPVPYGFH